MYLNSNRLGDTLVSVGMDKVAKVWKISKGMLYPIRLNSIYIVIKLIPSFEVVAPAPRCDCSLPVPGQSSPAGWRGQGAGGQAGAGGGEGPPAQ